jgi:hypothetical protein
MTNTDVKKRARQVIEVITVKLDRNLIKSQFDEPIYRAAEEFRCETELPVSHKAFKRIAGDFVQQIYRKALNVPWISTDPRTEAIFLLENYYNSPVYGPGYDAAMLNANDEAEGGIQTVLTGLAESIKNVERQKYIEGVLTWHLHSCSWELLCEIAQILLEDYRQFISPLLSECVPAQLVDKISTIMYMYIDSDLTLQQISLGNEEPSTADTLLYEQKL